MANYYGAEQSLQGEFTFFHCYNLEPKIPLNGASLAGRRRQRCGQRLEFHHPIYGHRNFFSIRSSRSFSTISLLLYFLCLSFATSDAFVTNSFKRFRVNQRPKSSTYQIRKRLLQGPGLFNLAGRIQQRQDDQLHDSSVLFESFELKPEHSHQNNQPTNSHDIFDKNNVVFPNHVAFICDGNSRWAKAKNLPTSAGHLAGADRLVELLKVLKRTNGVNFCTLYGFSTENWRRSQAEIDTIFHVMEKTARQFYRQAVQESQLRIKVLGDLSDERIPPGLTQILHKLEMDTKRSDQNEESLFTVCLAVNYGARQDILNASVRLAKLLLEEQQRLTSTSSECETVGASKVSGISNETQVQNESSLVATEEMFESMLCTAGIPDPDLIIRTSGECRLSNFLLWNCAYSEIYFSETYWPDFDEECWKAAVRWYSGRKRRFGARNALEQRMKIAQLTQHSKQ